MDDDWPDSAELFRGLLQALATADPASTDWAGELVVTIDRAVAEQVAAVVAHAQFASLHAAWFSVTTLTGAVPDVPSVPQVEVQVCDAAAAELVTDEAGGWLHHSLYAGPLDTRGGRPVALLVAVLSISDPDAFAVVAERALCPVLVPAGPAPATHRFLIEVPGVLTLRPPLSADPDWAAWFDWPTVADGPLVGSQAYGFAAAAIRSVVAHGWPFDVPGDADGRLLMATRVGQIVAVRCREMAGRRPADMAADVVDWLRGRHVGPRLPLGRVDLAIETTGGRLACTLRLSPRLGGDDPADVPVEVRVQLSAG